VQKICPECGKNFTGHSNRIYCEDEDCIRERTRIRKEKSRKRLGYNDKNVKGTSGISSHRLPDPVEEYNTVQKELRRLGLR
jgi:hypothetical protein